MFTWVLRSVSGWEAPAFSCVYANNVQFACTHFMNNIRLQHATISNTRNARIHSALLVPNGFCRWASERMNERTNEQTNLITWFYLFSLFLFFSPCRCCYKRKIAALNIPKASVRQVILASWSFIRVPYLNAAVTLCPSSRVFERSEYRIIAQAECAGTRNFD